MKTVRPIKNPEKEIDFSNPELEMDYNASNIVIYDIDKIDKVYKDLIEATEKIQILKKTSISGSLLEVEKKGIASTILNNSCKYLKKKKIIKMGNGETFKGKIIEEKKKEKNDKNETVEKTYIILDNGVYTWKQGETYQGSFNKNNNFEGKGTLIIKDNNGNYTSLESVFSNGYPANNNSSIFKLSLKKLYDLYIQSNIIKNENENSPFKLVLNGKTTITKSQGGEEVYRFDGEIKNGKIEGYATIKRRYKVTRMVEINIVSKNNNIELEINNIKPSKTFFYKANYTNGLKFGKFTLIDEKEHIKAINEEAELYKLLIKFKRLLIRKNGINCFEKIYRYKLPPLKLFNRTYHTKINESDSIVHIVNKTISLEGLLFFARITLTNLRELALNDSRIKDFSPLEKADYPSLNSLSLGKNQIISIDSINKLPFPKLELFMLGFNKIEKISPLEQYKSNNLKVLALIGNSISNITPLEKMYAPNLEQISLGSNIKNISVFTKCNFPKLKQLGLKGNKIKNISSLIDVNFPLLEILYLSNNEIIDITPLKKANFPHLVILGLDYNKIKNINPLLHLKSEKLNFLNISHNQFRPASSEYKQTIDFLKRKIKDIKY